MATKKPRTTFYPDEEIYTRLVLSRRDCSKNSLSAAINKELADYYLLRDYLVANAPHILAVIADDNPAIVS